MRISCSGLELSEALTRVSKAIPARRTIPILEGIKMKAEGNSVCLYATDNNFTVIKTINATVYSEGEAVVSGKMFSELIKKLSDVDVELELGAENKLLIKYPDGQTDIACYNAEEYPPVLSVNSDDVVKIKQGAFKEMINKIIFCAGGDDGSVSVIPKGCLMEVNADVLKIVAMDNCRLGFAKCKLDSKHENIKALVPSRNIAEISRLLEEDDLYCEIVFSSRKILVDLGHTQIISVLFDGEFLDYQRMIDEVSLSEAVVNKNQFEDSMDRAFVVCKNVKQNVVALNIREDFIAIRSTSEIGNINENIPASLKGKDIDISLNAKYLLDCLRAVNDDFIRICLRNGKDIIKIMSADGDDYVYIIMPVSSF